MRALLFNPTRRPLTALQQLLQQAGFTHETAETEERFAYLLGTDSFSATLVIRVPIYEAISELFASWKREGGKGLFVVISNNQSGLLRAKCLEMGVSHYYIEPFSLVQMIQEIAREAYSLPVDQAIFRTERFEVNLSARTISYDGRELSLTRKEFDILSYLLRCRTVVLSRSQIWEEAWGYDDYPLANTVDVHIARLRKKLGCCGNIISTVHGIGYRLNEPL